MEMFEQQRQQLMNLLRQSGIQDARVLAALEHVPREQFVSEEQHAQAYTNRPLPLILGQTISQPQIVAIMTQALALSGRERVLEIGTGSGYQTAILAHLASYVYSVERYPQLAYQAASRIAAAAINNVSIYIADGSLGWPELAPYDRILVTAAAPKIPPQLLAQLAPNGILVIPIGNYKQQELLIVTQTEQGQQVKSLGHCLFVPLVGEAAWSEGGEMKQKF